MIIIIMIGEGRHHRGQHDDRVDRDNQKIIYYDAISQKMTIWHMMADD